MKRLTSKYIQKRVKEIDWSFAEADTKSMAHNIHRYSGKYIPQIAGSAIDLISLPGDLILDPYVGSGTTLVEANLKKRKSVGLDLNPLAVLLASTKINPISRQIADDLINYLKDFIEKMESHGNGQQHALTNHILAASSFWTDEWFNKWFSKENLTKLILIKDAIDKIPDDSQKSIALVAFSNILRKCSNAHSGYPNVMLDKNKVNKNNVSRIFLKELEETCTKLGDQFEHWNDIESKVIEADAGQMSLDDESIDAIITHPPYIGSVPYAEYGLLSLKWLGHDPKEIDKKLTGGQRQKSDVVERFKERYSQMIKESYRVLKPGSYMFILIGHPTVKGERYDLGDMTLEFAGQTGFKLVAREFRNGSNRRANKMGHEDLIFLQK